MARRRVFQRAAARRTTWEGATLADTVTSGASSFSTIVAEATLENVPNPTIVRIRGNILIRMAAQGAAATTGQLFMGIRLATASAIAAGIGSIETPANDIGSDWLWWTVAGFHTGASAQIDNVAFGATSRDVLVDSKAMRKVGVNMGLIFVMQHNAVVSTQTLSVIGGFRVLLKI